MSVFRWRIIWYHVRLKFAEFVAIKFREIEGILRKNFRNIRKKFENSSRRFYKYFGINFAKLPGKRGSDFEDVPEKKWSDFEKTEEKLYEKISERFLRNCVKFWKAENVLYWWNFRRFLKKFYSVFEENLQVV